MKKIFNNSKSVFNAAILTAVVVATSLFTSCSKDSSNQNDPFSGKTDTEVTKPTEDKTPATAKIATSLKISKGVTDHYNLEMTAKDKNGNILKDATDGKASTTVINGLFLFSPTYEISTFPNEVTLKFKATLKDGESDKYKSDTPLSENIIVAFGYSSAAYTSSNSKISDPVENSFSPKDYTTSKTFADYVECVQSAIKGTHLDKTFKFKFDAKGQVTVEEVQ